MRSVYNFKDQFSASSLQRQNRVDPGLSASSK